MARSDLCPPFLTPPTGPELASWPYGTLFYARMAGTRFCLAKVKTATEATVEGWVMSLPDRKWPSPSQAWALADVAGLASGWPHPRLVIVGGGVTVPLQVPP